MIIIIENADDKIERYLLHNCPHIGLAPSSRIYFHKNHLKTKNIRCIATIFKGQKEIKVIEKAMKRLFDESEKCVEKDDNKFLKETIRMLRNARMRCQKK